jgi:O-antigen ligase
VRSTYTVPSQSPLLNRIAFAALWLLVFTVPWEKSVVMPGIGTVSRLIGACAFALGLLSAVMRKRIRMPGLALQAMVAFLFWTLATAYWTMELDGTYLYVLTLAQLVAMVWLVWDLNDSDQRQLSLMRAYVFGTVVSGAYTLVGYFQDKQALGGYFYGRYAASGFNPNDLGLTIALSIPFSYYLMLKSSSRMAWLYRGQIALAIVTIVLTASRSALVACCVALLIVPCTVRWLSARNFWATTVVAVLLMMVALPLLPDSLWDRLATTGTEISSGTLNERTMIWNAGETVFWSHPFVGVGAGAFATAVQPLIGKPPTESMEQLNETNGAYVAHNTFISVLVETGLVGFMIFCTILLLMARHILEMPSLEKWLWAVTLLVWVTSVSVATWEIRKPTWIIFSLLLAQAAASREPVTYRLQEIEGNFKAELFGFRS